MATNTHVIVGASLAGASAAAALRKEGFDGRIGERSAARFCPLHTLAGRYLNPAPSR